MPCIMVKISVFLDSISEKQNSPTGCLKFVVVRVGALFSARELVQNERAQSGRCGVLDLCSSEEVLSLSSDIDHHAMSDHG